MLFDTCGVARRVLVVVAVATSLAVVAAAVIALTRQGSSRPSTSQADVYTQLAQQLKRHLRPLVSAKVSVKHAPTIQIPQQQGYSCEVASGTGCSLRPCVKYAIEQMAVPANSANPAIGSTTSGHCASTGKATPRAIPIVAP